MSNQYRMSNEKFEDFQNRFREASPKDQEKLVKELIDSLYTDIHEFFKRQAHPGNMQTTEMVLSFSGRKLDNFRKQFDVFQNAESLDMYMHYLWRGIKWFVHDKIRSERRNKTVSLSSSFGGGDDDDNGQFDVPEDPGSPEIKEAARQMMQILNELLDEDDKELLMLVYDGIRFDSVSENKNTEFCNSDGRKRMQMTYGEIAEYLGGGQTADSIRMRHNRLIKKLQKSNALILLMRDSSEF